VANDDSYDDDLNDDTEDTAEEQVPNWRRNLERKAKKEAERATAAEDRATKAERKLAFVQAGVDPDDPKARYFVTGYDGDLTKEAVTAAAAEIGLIEAPAAAEEDAVPADQQAAWSRTAGIQAGGESVGSHGIDDAIRDATQAGDHLRAIALKREKAGLHK
jgi:hypothetical protein